jgi:hypothetical protein
VREPEKVKGLWPFQATLLSAFRDIHLELQQSRFLRVQFQSELTKPLPAFCQKPLGVRFMLKAQGDIVSIAKPSFSGEHSNRWANSFPARMYRRAIAWE